VSAGQLEEVKEWLKGELKKSTEENSLERKNTSDSTGFKEMSSTTATNIITESLLMCLKYTIELNIFTNKES